MTSYLDERHAPKPGEGSELLERVEGENAFSERSKVKNSPVPVPLIDVLHLLVEHGREAVGVLN